MDDRVARKERSDRARALRDSIGLNRKFVATKYRLPPSTLQSWEDISFGGMPESGAKRLAAIYQAEGLNVTEQWLMYGIGEPPLPHLSKKSISPKQSLEDIILQELKLFLKLNHNCAHTIINDDALAPFLLCGDYVAGPWYFDKDIKKAVDYPCIVQTSKKMIVRVLTAGDDADHYTLTSYNASAKNAQMKNIKLVSVAPIVWIRKVGPR